MNRFTMNFDNFGPSRSSFQTNNLAYQISQNPRPRPVIRNIPLNAGMIDRVHKAKPGCSACGKKVA
jgi:hypothetical protein